MAMECPPIAPHPSLLAYQPAAERTLSVFGQTAQLALIPGRQARSGYVREDRPALQRSPVDRILREETYWQTESLALTANKFPFAKNQRILWMAQPAREPDAIFWHAALAWVRASNGTALLNNVGAAATIARAHAHLIDEQLAFLRGLPERPLMTDLIDVPNGVTLIAKDVPFCVVGVRGNVAAQAEALMLLGDARLTATWNVILMPDTAWIVPRRQQTPRPFFDQAVGAAEFWGRWCYVEQAAFDRAASRDLEQALLLATAAAID